MDEKTIKQIIAMQAQTNFIIISALADIQSAISLLFAMVKRGGMPKEFENVTERIIKNLTVGVEICTKEMEQNAKLVSLMHGEPEVEDNGRA